MGEEAAPAPVDVRPLMKDTELARGPPEKLEFQAESRKLLDIVAKSLYSDREVCSSIPTFTFPIHVTDIHFLSWIFAGVNEQTHGRD